MLALNGTQILCLQFATWNFPTLVSVIFHDRYPLFNTFTLTEPLTLKLLFFFSWNKYFPLLFKFMNQIKTSLWFYHIIQFSEWFMKVLWRFLLYTIMSKLKLTVSLSIWIVCMREFNILRQISSANVLIIRWTYIKHWFCWNLPKLSKRSH